MNLGIAETDTDKTKYQGGDGIGFPVHIVVVANPDNAINKTLDRSDNASEDIVLALIDFCHIGAQRFYQQEQNEQVQTDLQPPENGHLNHSGLRRARTR